MDKNRQAIIVHAAEKWPLNKTVFKKRQYMRVLCQNFILLLGDPKIRADLQTCW